MSVCKVVWIGMLGIMMNSLKWCLSLYIKVNGIGVIAWVASYCMVDWWLNMSV
jgi:hypothetical protein